MKRKLSVIVLGLLLTGCVTRAKYREDVHEANVQGRREVANDYESRIIPNLKAQHSREKSLAWGEGCAWGQLVSLREAVKYSAREIHSYCHKRIAELEAER